MLCQLHYIGNAGSLHTLDKSGVSKKIKGKRYILQQHDNHIICLSIDFPHDTTSA